MFIRSIGGRLGSAEELSSLVQVINSKVLPNLKSEYQLIQASMLASGETTLAAVLVFESELDASFSVAKLIEAAGSPVPADRLIERDHVVVAAA